MDSIKELKKGNAGGHIRDMYETFKSDFGASKISPSTLRFAKPWAGGASILTFDVKDNVGTPIVLENRLLTGDVFLATRVGLFIHRAGAVVASITDQQIMASKRYTHPNALVFAAANESAGLESVYNGFLRMRVEETDRIRKLDCRRFYRADYAQETVGSAAASNNPFTANSYPNEDYGSVELTPQFRLFGNREIELTLDMKAAVTAFTPSSATDYVVVEMRGFVAIGAENKR